MELTELQALIAEKPELAAGILPTVIETEAGKNFMRTKVETGVGEVIGEKTKSIYDRLDNDMFETLGERPERSDDGSKTKTYEKQKQLYLELAELRKTKDSLSKDEEVKRLNTEIENLKTDGAAKQVQEQFDTAKNVWMNEKTEMQKRLDNQSKSNDDFQKLSLINAGLSNIKFNPDVSDTFKNMALTNERQALLEKAVIREGKLVFLDESGKVELNTTTYEPIDVQGKLAQSAAIGEISLKEDNKGGNAATEFGKIETTSVEGKDAKKLKLVPGSIKTKTQFIEVTEKAFKDNGITRSNPDWKTLQDAAYKEHNVSALPD